MSSLGMAIDVLGWFGAVIVVAAYGLISYASISGRGATYQSLNVVGSVLLIVNTAWHHAWPSCAVNVVWALIAIGSLITFKGEAARCEPQSRSGWRK